MAFHDNDSLYTLVQTAPLFIDGGILDGTTRVLIFEPFSAANGVMFIPRMIYNNASANGATVSITNIAEFNNESGTYVDLPDDKLIGSYADTVNGPFADPPGSGNITRFLNGIGVISTTDKLQVTLTVNGATAVGGFIICIDTLVGPSLLPAETEVLTNRANKLFVNP